MRWGSGGLCSPSSVGDSDPVMPARWGLKMFTDLQALSPPCIVVGPAAPAEIRQATWVHPTGGGVDHSSHHLVEDTLFSLPCFPVHTFGWWVWRDWVKRSSRAHGGGSWVRQGPLIQTEAGRPAPAH